MFLVRTGMACVVWLVCTPSLRAQVVLDLLDGETLYDGGFLVSLSSELSRGDELRAGTRRVPGSGISERYWSNTVAVQYGLRHDLQVGLALSYEANDRDGFTPADADGIGDLSLLAKWRFYRWDAPSKALNVAILGELSVPTGEDDATSGGMRIEPELQVGSGGLDPSVGFAATYEPGRWRFNGAALYRSRTDTDGDDTRLGDELVAELEIGNRFWLEPYPGPFMRLDLATRYYWQDKSERGGRLSNTGSERATVVATWAFRPRPAIDIQTSFEVPYWQEVNGTQVGRDWSIAVAFGYRF